MYKVNDKFNFVTPISEESKQFIIMGAWESNPSGLCCLVKQDERYCHSYTGRMTPVNNIREITEDEFELMSGGHPGWFNYIGASGLFAEASQTGATLDNMVEASYDGTGIAKEDNAKPETKSNIGTSEEGELAVDVVPTDISGKINLNSETVIPLSQIDIYLKPFYKKNEDFTKDIEKLKLFQQNTNIILTELSRKERRILEVELKVERLIDHIRRNINKY